MPDAPFIVDSHVHLDQVAEHSPDRVAWLKNNKVILISWAWCPRVETRAELAAYLEGMARRVRGLAEQGLACRYLAGIHPRNITPDLDPARVEGLLAHYMEDPLCLGLGETGLETADAREKEILCAQAEFFLCARKQRDLVLGVHTPRKDKDRVAEELRSLLAGFDLPRDRVVVDHCTPSTAPRFLEAGYWAGVTLSPVKSSADDLLSIARALPEHAGRILANTDSGTEFHTDLFDLARTPPGDADPALIRRLTRDNALKFYDLQG